VLRRARIDIGDDDWIRRSFIATHVLTAVQSGSVVVGGGIVRVALRTLLLFIVASSGPAEYVPPPRLRKIVRATHAPSPGVSLVAASTAFEPPPPHAASAITSSASFTS
jgi:hypothetical protein